MKNLHRREALRRVAIAVASVLIGGANVGVAAANAPLATKVSQRIASRIITVHPTRYELAHRVDGTAIVLETPKISAQTAGTIVELHADIGQVVTKGELLALIDSPEVQFGFESAVAEVARVKALAAQKKNHAARQATLRSKELVSKAIAENAQLDARAAQQAVESAESQVQIWQSAKDKLYVRAPFDARVVERHVTLGDYVTAGTPVATLIQPEQTVIEMAVPERAMRTLEVGSPVRVELGTGEQFRATVTRISPVVEVATRTVVVHVAPAEDAAVLVRPGSSAQVELTEIHANVFSVPESAVVSEQSNTFVYTLDAALIASRKAVTVMARTRGQVIIGAGLAAGDRVAIDADFLYEGATIREVMNP